MPGKANKNTTPASATKPADPSKPSSTSLTPTSTNDAATKTPAAPVAPKVIYSPIIFTKDSTQSKTVSACI